MNKQDKWCFKQYMLSSLCTPSYPLSLNPVRCRMVVENCLPGGGGGDLIVVVLSQDLEQLVEKHWQESDNHWDSLHTKKTLKEDGKEV